VKGAYVRGGWNEHLDFAAFAEHAMCVMGLNDWVQCVLIDDGKARVLLKAMYD
jgi:hypothetical protein